MQIVTRVPRALRWTGIVTGAVVLAIVLTLVWLERADLRGPASRMLTARLGQPVRITHELDLKLLSLTPGAIVSGLELGSPEWAGKTAMARIERLTVDVKLLSLLTGDIVLPRLLIEQPDVHLLRDATGRANWPSQKGGERQGKPPKLPLVQQFTVSDGRVSLVDELRQLTFSGSIEARERAGSRSTAPMRLESHGELNGKAFHFELRGGALVNVRRDRPYPFEYEVKAGDTRMTARGAIARPFDLGHYEADIEISGKDVADLYYLTDLTLPNTPPYRVKGHAQRAASRLYLHAFSGFVGDSDVDLEATVDMGPERPFVKADVVSRTLDLDDLGVPLGAAPSVKQGETASSEQRMEAKEMKARRRLFPDAELQVHRLRGMDAELQFHAEAVEARKVPLREVDFRLRLEKGVLTLDPVSFVLPQGRLTGTARVDARKDVPASLVDARLTGLQLGQFRPRTAKQAPIEGALLGRMKLEGPGSSVREFVAAANGELTLVLPKGGIREAFAELTGINVARGLGLLLRDDEDQTDVRCGVADFAVKGGTLHAKNIVFDTDNVLITGQGAVDLEAEAFDLTIKGHPKKLRLFRVRSPIAIRGPLRKPDIGLESGDSLAQTGVAAALGAAVAPLAAVIAFVDPGLAEDANCAALLAEAKREGAPVKTADVNKADRG